MQVSKRENVTGHRGKPAVHTSKMLKKIILRRNSLSEMILTAFLSTAASFKDDLDCEGVLVPEQNKQKEKERRSSRSNPFLEPRQPWNS